MAPNQQITPTDFPLKISDIIFKSAENYPLARQSTPSTGMNAQVTRRHGYLRTTMARINIALI